MALLGDGTPPPAKPKTWRPWTLEAPFLVTFTFLIVLTCAVIELVLRGCSENGCRVFGRLSTADLSKRTDFAYNQLPTFINTGLGLLWALPTLEVLRLEPYFQMSASEAGASPHDSLFLRYPYMLPLIIPFIAVKQRHYVVALASAIFFCINFINTPLIAGIFDDATLEKLQPGLATRSSVIPLNSSNEFDLTSAHFPYVAYDYTWLHGTLPSFTTPEYTLLPIINDTGLQVGNESWTAPTTLYEAELSCTSAATVDWSYTGNNGVIMDITAPGGDYTMRFCDELAAATNGSIDGCDSYTAFATRWTSIAERVPGTDHHLFAWALGPYPEWLSSGSQPLPTNVTAIFCNTSYFSQPVTATFSMPHGVVKGLNRTGTRAPLLGMGSFERIIGGEVMEGEHDIFYLDGMPANMPSPDSRLRKLLGTRASELNAYFDSIGSSPDNTSHSSVYMRNVYGLEGFALFNSTLETLPDLLDPGNLALMYQRAVKLLFSLAIAVDMVDEHAAEEVLVVRRVWTRGFKVDPRWARAAQGGLSLVAVMIAVLTFLVRRRELALDGDPNTIAEALRLLKTSPELRDQLANAEFYHPDEVGEVLDNCGARYKLLLEPGMGPRMHISTTQEVSPLGVPDVPVPFSVSIWSLKRKTGIFFGSFCCVVVALMVAAFITSNRQNGLPTIASVNSVGYKILFSYIPTVTGSFTEIFLLLLSFVHFILAPYLALSQDARSAEQSLTINYDISSPTAQVMRTFYTRNYPVAILSVAVLISSFLGTILAGVFAGIIAESPAGIQLRVRQSPSISNAFTESVQEMYFILAESLVGNIPVPEWTTSDYYVVPFLPEQPLNLTQFQGPTFAVGLDIQCTAIDDNKVDRRCSGANITELSQCDAGSTILTHVDDPCWGDLMLDMGRSSSLPPTGPSHSSDRLIRSTTCSDTFFAAWVETNIATNDTQEHSDPSALVMRCGSSAKWVNLTVTVDRRHEVRRTIPRVDRVRSLNYTNGMSSELNLLSSSFLDVVLAGIEQDNHRNSHDLRWFNHLMALLRLELINNDTRLPDRSQVAASFQDVYRRLFVIALRLYSEDIFSLGQRHQVPGSAVLLSDRVQVKWLMFTLATTIYGFIFVAVVVVYCNLGKHLGPVPTTLVRVYSLLYASNAMEECGQMSGKNPDKRAKSLKSQGGEYVYGEFHVDEESHYGVYRKNELS